VSAPETTDNLAELSSEEMQSALFAQLVMQQSNMALMLLGRRPHPETGQTLRDLDAARLFIDPVEMLEAKTTGNLNPQESALLKQSLMTLRMAFVDAVNEPAPAPAPTAPAASQTDQPVPPAAESAPAPAAESSSAAETESTKRFSKKISI